MLKGKWWFGEFKWQQPKSQVHQWASLLWGDIDLLKVLNSECLDGDMAQLTFSYTVPGLTTRFTQFYSPVQKKVRLA